ncbi:hypothetical protein HHK36_019496 [Tetracentron sinense]|uniref:Uncharacterized protein n=1 Tax=Tetracentron sinense TaxID=13715 RepID=A0A835D9N5_TETSI|nr:hypothetical protein HHK36_019496 [Tetracentron sinense]
MTDTLDGKASEPITETLSQRENGEYCMRDLSADLCIPQNMVEDYSSTVCPLSEDKSKNIPDTVQVNHHEKKTSFTESDLTAPKSGINVEAEMVYSMMKPCSNKDIDSKIAGGNDSCNIGSLGQKGMPTGDMVDSVMKPCSNECIGAKIAGGNDSCTIGLSGQDGMPTGDHPLAPFKSNSRNMEKVQVIMASKRNKLLQTAMRVLLEKQDKLTRQQRDTEDEIARCNKNLQTILSGYIGYSNILCD